MGLDLKEVKELIKNPRNKAKINDARYYQDRLRFHSTPFVSSRKGYDYDPSKYNEAYRVFLMFLRSLVPLERFERLKQFLGTPIATNSFVSNIFNNYLKVFESNDYKIDFNFEDNKENLEEDFKEFIKEGNISNWNTLAMEEFKNNICSFMVVDAEKEQKGERPEPYVNFVSIYKVIDASINDDNSVNYLIYKNNDKIIQVDNEYYRIFDCEENDPSYNNIKLSKRGEIRHGKGKTPARQFWTTNLGDTNEFVKRSTLSESLWQLDMLLLAITAKEYVQMYAKSPIVVKVDDGETDEDYENNIPEYSPNSSGDDGYANDFGGQYQYNYSYGQDLSKKADKDNNLMIAGTEMEVPRPDETNPEIKDPIRFIVPPIDNLRYIDESEYSRKEEIYINAVGAIPDFKNDQAKNEKQVESQLESQKSILDFIQYNIEKAERWALAWMGEVRYSDKFKSVSLDYGKQRFLKTTSDLIKELEVQSNESQRFEITRQINNTKYKNDDYQQQRQDLMLLLEPFPTHSILEVLELQKGGLNVSNDIILKSNLSQYIKEFENIKGDVVDFVQNGNSNNRIEEIKAFINKKVEDGKPKEDAGTGTLINEKKNSENESRD